MAGLSFGDDSRGGRRSLDSDVNMIPMIDLLVVTISFLLLTAVWVHLPRLDASARVPEAAGEPCTGSCKDRELVLDMTRPDKLVLSWRDGGTTLKTSELARNEAVLETHGQKFVRLAGLGEALHAGWDEMGVHRAPDDRRFDRLVLRTDDGTPFASIVAAMDAAHGVKRELRIGKQSEMVPAMSVTFSTH
jgi:biopolymer transport protein ExbD